INEFTTVAGEWALAQFTDSTGQTIVAPSTNATGFTNSVNQAQANLADVSTGLPAAFWTNYTANEANCTGGSAPTNCAGERMNTFANILAACIETSGPSSGACTTLLGDTGSSTTTLQGGALLGHQSWCDHEYLCIVCVAERFAAVHARAEHRPRRLGARSLPHSQRSQHQRATGHRG
ncbi:MAG: hypothetical protein ABSG46_17280, partial [Candidatus Binataceae bacterium]